MNEREIAVMEGEMIHHEDAYFDARPQVDTGHNRHIFREGFERAWKASREDRVGQESETAVILKAGEHLRRVMEEHPYCDHVQVVKNFADIRIRQKRRERGEQNE